MSRPAISAGWKYPIVMMKATKPAAGNKPHAPRRSLTNDSQSHGNAENAIRPVVHDAASMYVVKPVNGSRQPTMTAVRLPEPSSLAKKYIPHPAKHRNASLTARA